MWLIFLIVLMCPVAAEAIPIESVQSFETSLTWESVYVPWHKTAVLSHEQFFRATHGNDGEGYADFSEDLELPRKYTWVNSLQPLPSAINGYSQSSDLTKTMVIDLFNRSVNLPATHLNIGLVETQKAQEDWIEVSGVSNGMSKQTVRSYFEDVFKNPSPQFEFLLGYKNNQPVVSCVIYYEGEYASIYWVGTIPSERRQGFGTLIMEEALNRIRRRNIRWVVLQAQPKGIGIYQQIGFWAIGYLARY